MARIVFEKSFRVQQDRARRALRFRHYKLRDNQPPVILSEAMDLGSFP